MKIMSKIIVRAKLIATIALIQTTAFMLGVADVIIDGEDGAKSWAEHSCALYQDINDVLTK